MSNFECPVVRVTIEAHPNADAIELARVGDYLSVVKKGQFKDGDLAIYLPEGAIVPDWMLKEMNFWDAANEKGSLHGSAGNRIRAMRLRGIMSQGIIYSGVEAGSFWVKIGHPDKDSLLELHEGEDASEALGVIKYEPPIPSHMMGRVVGVNFGATHSYDFENLKKFPSLFDEGEQVVITEKIHGTLMSVSVVPSSEANEKYYEGRVVLTSKGMGARGCILDHNDETNLYAQAAKKHGLLKSMLTYFGNVADRSGKPVFLFGEVFGKTMGGAGIQDLTYTDEPLDYRAFDICIGNRGNEEYLPFPEFVSACGMNAMNLPIVPLLYVGPYSKDIVLEHTDGPTTMIPPRGKCAHIREGVVVKSESESKNKHFGRKIAKSVSEKYLLRKGGGTEYQ